MYIYVICIFIYMNTNITGQSFLNPPPIPPTQFPLIFCLLITPLSQMLKYKFAIFIFSLNLFQPTLTYTLGTFKNSILPYRPISTNRIGSISFTTKSAKVVKTFNLEAHTKYFEDIVGLWGSIFLEEQLKDDKFDPNKPHSIDKENPECRDLRAIVMEELKSVNDILHANIYIFDDHRHTITKRHTYTQSATLTIPLPSLPKTKKRSIIASSALTLFKAYMAKKGAARLASSILPSFGSNSNPGIIPIGGDILSYVFGVASAKDTLLNKKMINALRNKMENIGKNQVQLVQYANLTSILMTELANLISENDKIITYLFNETQARFAKQQRSIICLKLFAQASYIIDVVKSNINEFILADTLIPQGNKKLFSERELRLLTNSMSGYQLATGDRNLWDYPLFSMTKSGLDWTYSIHIPLTNLPFFTNYKISPFPVFPQPNPFTAFQVEIDTNTNVILATNEKYFIDKIDKETCSFSGTHGVCAGNIGLIDIDFAPCSVCLLLHSPTDLLKKCKFIPYTGTFPRIASSMGKFLLSSKVGHAFIESCPGKRTGHLKTKPGSTSLSLNQGCSLNASDIKLLLPLDNSVLSNQKIDTSMASVLRFDEPLPLNKAHLVKSNPLTLHLKRQIKDLQKHQDRSIFNTHFRNYSTIYLPIILLLFLVIIAGISFTYFKLSIHKRMLTAIRFVIQPYLQKALVKRKEETPTDV